MGAITIQAGASGPWVEYNQSIWERSLDLRALPHCGASGLECAYISGSKQQQHTHGLYVRIQRRCNGKPVYLQQTGDGANFVNGHKTAKHEVAASSSMRPARERAG